MEREDLPKHQQAALEIIEDIVGLRFEHSHANLSELASAMGYSRGQLMRELTSLQYKGFLQRALREEGGKPRDWIVVQKPNGGSEARAAS